jgi:hypothetical protein
MKILVCGGRDFSDYPFMSSTLESINPTQIISGGARGADRLAERYAVEFGVPIQVFPALWDTEGKAAGFIRNQRMLDEGDPDLVVAFPGGRGTDDMVRRAIRHGVKVIRPIKE